MQYPERNVEITDLDLTVYNDLVNELSKNSDWKKVADYIARTRGWPRRKWIDDLERRGNSPNSKLPPADLLLKKLASLLCNVGILCKILRSCDLLYALYVIVGIEKLTITKQPYPNENETSYEAEIGDQFSIECIATGVPPPQYQWYHGNVEILGQTSSTLCLPITSPDQEGEYQCRVSQYDRDGKLLHDKYSNCAPLKIRPTPVQIMKHTLSHKVKLKEVLTLECEATSHPSPCYQWYKDGKELIKQTSDTLRIKKFQQEHAGEYHCLVSNGNCKKWTGGIEIKVKDPPKTTSAKIALIIANSDYQYSRKLPLAEKDGISLAKKLRAMSFQVLLLQNLTLKEMEAAVELFCSALETDSYGLFYFVGHGCMNKGYQMIPIDVPEGSWHDKAYPQQHFLNAAQERKPALLVCILDMCLTQCQNGQDRGWQNEFEEMCKSKCHNSLILAYPTSSHRPSYEIKDAKNGIYMSHLRKLIHKKKPAYELFQEVAAAVIRSTTHKTRDQRPMFHVTLGELNLCLTDEVICPESLQKKYSDLTKSISFRPKVIELGFPRRKVSFAVTIESLNPPCLNAMKLTTLGLEKWDVLFRISPDCQVKLSPMEKSCILYNLQRATKETLMIQIGHNGMQHDAICFPFTEHILAVVRKFRNAITPVIE